MAAVPFVVGQWVRGDRFYGRTAQIEEILDGHRNSIWLLGTRRIGKTSLLKQIEYIASTSPEPRYFPVFWDFQGAEAPEDLHLNFADALLDADERLERIGISLRDVEADDLFASLSRLRRRLRAQNLGLLLLCDEVEELIKLHARDPSLLRKLRHAMQSQGDIRSVLASTIRLWALADQREDTSPFLHGYAPPLYIERLSDDEARSLIAQSHLGAAERPPFAEATIESIREHCDNHPYLVQLVSKRCLETGGLAQAIEQVATDRMVSYFFSVDFDMLSEAERRIIRIIAQDATSSRGSLREALWLGSDALDDSLRRLENLGFIRGDSEQRFVLANYFFRRWLQEMRDHPTAPVTDAGPVSVSQGEKATPLRTGQERDAVIEQREPESEGDPSASGLLGELRRRSVFRVGLAYVAAAWVLLQVGDILFNFLDVPSWAGRLLLALLALGMPVALMLAWAFELTPEGVKRQADVDRSKDGAGRSGRKLDFVIIAILAVAVALLLLDKFG
jgi:hypothetical protein